ncbi:MAG: nitroreductase family protein [Candidatus Sabulitectum sp.]|nr:nitroreductase family protein [Candidatus Sabulitectum sp.]
MDFSELTEKTRSYRRFREERTISAGKLRKMISMAGMAPCASNLQRLRFSIVTDKKERSALFSGIGWAGYLADWDGPEPGKRPSAYIVIHAPEEHKFFTGIDVGIAASYMVLAASAEGIGSCMLLNFEKGAVDSIAPAEGYTVKLVIAFGYPGETVKLEKDSEKIRYWRDEKGVHHVPKLPSDSIILKG